MRAESIVIPVSLLVLVVSFWNRDRIPAPTSVLPEARLEPRQSRTDEAAFDVRYDDTDYRIAPEFDYELTGMVVSYRHHDGSSRMHRRAGDHLNMLDVCVVWGNNLKHPDINALDFWNGIFTCNVKTRSTAAWQAFDMYDLSNNHLISDRDDVRRSVRGLAVGDQIRVRGWLASYRGPAGTRGTSTTREDTGDGACETIYVRDFEVIKPSANPWRYILYGSALVLIAAIAVYLRRPYRPYAGRA